MKLRLILVLLLFPAAVHAQAPVAEELVQVHNVSNPQMNSIATPFAGSLAFNTTDATLYIFDGVNWIALSESGLTSVETKTASYTLTLADNNKIIEFNTAANVTCTIPAGLPPGFQVSITQLGTGRVEFVGGATVRNAYNAFRTARRYSKAGVEIASTGEAIISGDVAK
ncbi:hypothetical protein [Ostreibacterium oceani]|uniref:Uncharacterized protein n=1 Tax=Ostreibacterium oceani TaxID=2654998 RepID=A0A6N7F527_9GAMM|nr:hypothetical protein [Ostreibacterium oceani]MPV86986.1 hypothetical protein [Ostreibacterium oceani]